MIRQLETPKTLCAKHLGDDYFDIRVQHEGIDAFDVTPASTSPFDAETPEASGL